MEVLQPPSAAAPAPGAQMAPERRARRSSAFEPHRPRLAVAVTWIQIQRTYVICFSRQTTLEVRNWPRTSGEVQHQRKDEFTFSRLVLRGVA